MLYQSTSIDPLNARDLTTEYLSGGAHIVRTRNGEVVQTADAMGVRRDFAREALTRKLLVRKLGVWSKLDGCCLDAAGTLFYRKGDLEVQERLDGVHIQTNKQTGVMIQTDQVNHCEIIRQSNGEVWKREVDETRELFEMWMHNNLTFRSQTFSEPRRCQADTQSGLQPFIYVDRLEQSFSHGLVTREKYSFRNPITGEQDVALTVPVDGRLTTMRNVQAVITTFVHGHADQTVYQQVGGNQLSTESGGGTRESSDMERLRKLVQADASPSGSSSVFVPTTSTVFTGR